MKVELYGVAWEFVQVKPDDLIPNDRNPRKITPEKLEELKARIQSQGFRVPPSVDADGTILCGHQRIRALQEMGNGQTPIVIARAVVQLPDDIRREVVAADNLSWGEHDWDILLEDYDVEELLGYGFDDAMIPDDEVDVDEVEDPDDMPDDEEVHFITKTGDVWDIGEHRLICGDSTLADTYVALCGEEPCHMMWTDPPYNVNYEGRAGKIKNDHMGDGDFYQFLLDFYSAAATVLRAGGSAYIAHADTEGLNFRAAFRDAGFKLSGCLIWLKPSLVLGRSDYQWQHEPILYGWLENGSHKWYGGRKQTTALNDEDDVVVTELEKDRLYNIDNGDALVQVSGESVNIEVVEGSVIRVDKPKRSDEHPTMKPVDLIERMLKNSSRTGQRVLDPFGGSGSTMVACQINRRVARLVELDPKFCDVIVARMHKLFPELEILHNGNVYKPQKEKE